MTIRLRILENEDELIRKREVGAEGGLKTMRLIACLDEGFRHWVLWSVPQDVPHKALN